MTKLSNLKAMPSRLVPGGKTANEVRQQRLAMLARSKQVAQGSVICMPDGTKVEGDEKAGLFYFGIAQGLTWVLGEENLPMQDWSMPV